jgi:hypothetical protein
MLRDRGGAYQDTTRRWQSVVRFMRAERSVHGLLSLCQVQFPSSVFTSRMTVQAARLIETIDESVRKYCQERLMRQRDGFFTMVLLDPICL